MAMPSRRRGQAIVQIERRSIHPPRCRSNCHCRNWDQICAAMPRQRRPCFPELNSKAACQLAYRALGCGQLPWHCIPPSTTRAQHRRAHRAHIPSAAEATVGWRRARLLRCIEAPPRDRIFASDPHRCLLRLFLFRCAPSLRRRRRGRHPTIVCAASCAARRGCRVAGSYCSQGRPYADQTRT